ncbi:MAG: ThiF family adenylyltransferase [Polyangiaceae bacterium]
MISNGNGIFSRETLAGYDRAVLDHAVVTLVGCGAAGNNIALNLALAGVGELRLIDFDHVDPSNVTRSPLFHRDRLQGSAVRHKAREVALGALACSHAPKPVVRFAVAPVESLGLGVFQDSGVIVAAVDSLSVRAYLADASRLLGIPLVEIGFSGSEGHVSLFSNQVADGPCWRCLHPNVSHGAYSCSLHARQILSEGRVPATQPLAAALGGITAEATIQALHRRFPLDSKAFHLDVRGGQSRLLAMTADARCPGEHRHLGTIRDIDIGPDDTALCLLEAIGAEITDPILHLPHPMVLEVPCAKCGSPVRVGKPAWSVKEAPSCSTCPETPRSGRGLLIETWIARANPSARMALRKLGICVGAVVEVEDGRSGQVRALRVKGTIDTLFVSKQRKNGTATI